MPVSDTNDAKVLATMRRQAASLSDRIDSMERRGAQSQATVETLRAERKAVLESIAALEREGQRG